MKLKRSRYNLKMARGLFRSEVPGVRANPTLKRLEQQELSRRYIDYEFVDRLSKIQIAVGPQIVVYIKDLNAQPNPTTDEQSD